MDVVIVGGGAAGMTAASRIKAIKSDWNVTVLEKTSFVSHAPCAIPFYVGRDIMRFEELLAYDVEYFRRERGIDVRVNVDVIEIGDGYVTALEKGRERVFEWDKLLVSTGARAQKLGAENEDLDGVFYVSDIEIAEPLRRLAYEAENIVIVGSGYIGVELADAIRRLGKKVTVVEAKERPLPEYDAEIAAILKSEMEKWVDLRLSEIVLAFSGKDAVESVITNKGEYKCDLAVVAVGVEPNTSLVEGYLELGVKGAIATNSRMETSVENVYAAGDCAEAINVVTGKPDWIPLATPANKMGYVAGVNMAEGYMEYPGSLKSQITSFGDIEIGKVGLSEHEALREGYEVVSAFITSRSNAKYMSDGLIHLKVVADRGGKILGVQAAGKGVGMRIYAASALLYKGCNIYDLFFTDFPYYPPISRVWDPLVVAARNLFRKLGLP